jgi:internalin A
MRGYLAIPGLVLGVGLSGTAIAQPIVTFPDPNLEAAVRSALSKPLGPLTSADLQGLTCLSACNRQITDLSGLEFASNLTGLYLNGNAIGDLTPLEGLNQLRSLELEKNNITDLSPLAALTNLSCLALGGSYPGDYSPLSNLTSLSSLSVRNGALYDLTVLQSLSGLSSLVLWQNGIGDPSPLAVLTNLNSLDLRWNSITNCTPLSGLPNLTSLYLGGNSLSNVPALQTLTRLALLNLDQNNLTDVSPLAGLTSLTYLSLNVNQITNLGVLSGLTGLVNVELRGNSISNLAFLSSLSRLGYADLAYNNITDLSPLAGLSNLNALVLAGNPLANYGQLPQLTSVSNLWLFANSLSNADSVTNLVWLNYLNLEQNSIADLSPLLELPDLTGLALSRNPITNYAPVAAFTNLSSLRLEGNSISDLTPLTNLTQLEFLSLSHNHIADLSPLEALTNLQNLYLQRNELSDIQPLANNFPLLLNVDLSLNFLDLSSNSTAMSVIQGLQSQTTGVFQCACTLGTNATQCQRVQVTYLPTNQPPSISVSLSIPGQWFIPCGTNSSLTVWVAENPPPEDLLQATAISSDTNLISIVSTNVSGSLPGTNQTRTLTLEADCNAPGNTATITLTVTDDVGLSSSTSMLVTVVMPIPLTDLLAPGVTNLDPNFEAGIQAASANYEGDLSSVDLLNLPSLYVNYADITGFAGWQWLTNLSTLYLGNCVISNLDFLTNTPHLTSLGLPNDAIHDLGMLTNLTQLVSLSLENNQITDISPLAGLTHLSYLNLGWNQITNFDEFLSGFTSVTSLDLGGNSISNVEFLTNLTQLTTLGLEDNRVTDVSPLDALTNLNSLTVQQNLLTNVTSLTNLLQLQTVDLTINLLDLSSGSDTAAAIQQLQAQGANVYDLPQREPPIITVPGFWFVPINATSSLSFDITDNAVYGSQFTVQAVLSDTNLVPNAGALVSGPDTNGNWTLALTPAANQTGTTNLTLVATDDAGLSSETNIQVSVLVPQVADIPDTNLLSAILTMLGEPAGFVTDVDLLNLTELDSYAAGISNLSGLQGATNLTALQLDGNSISDLSPLAHLWQITFLSLSNNFVTDISPLAGLTNLAYLNVAWNTITNYSLFLSGFGNLTSLDLGGDGISNVTFLTNLTQLEVLGLEDNWITDLSPLVGLTNLDSLNLQNNVVTNIQALTNLEELSFVDVSSNYLDTTDGSAAMATIRTLQGEGVTVYFLPQKEPPLPLDDQFFSTTNLMWQTGGDAPWYGQTSVSFQGIPAAQSGAIGNQRESWLEATVIGPGVLSFWWKVLSETNSDFLTFYIDTNEEAQISGEVDWQQQVYALSLGPHTLVWDYSKGLDMGSGLDAGWVAQVSFVLASWLQMAGSPTNGECTLNLWLPPGDAFEVQSSTDLANWSSLGMVTNSDTVTVTNQFTDTNAAPGARFYRLRELVGNQLRSTP